MAKNKKKKLIHLKDMLNMSELRNSSKTLLANIRFSSIDDPIKTIAIVSPSPNEGKTTVAVNLAASIASSGKTCLIVDCDMRKRGLYKILEAQTPAGILAVLSGERRLADTITATNIKNLYFLDCEPNIPSPPDILSTKRFASLVESLRDAFDFVIFDTSPILTFVDSAIVSNLVDATILCVKQGKTKKADLIDAKKQLSVAQANLLGGVLTFTDDVEADYYYAYYDKSGKRVDKSKKNAFAFSDEDVIGKSFGELQKSGNLEKTTQDAEQIRNQYQNFDKKKKSNPKAKHKKKSKED